jgi:hypothetical protein
VIIHLPSPTSWNLQIDYDKVFHPLLGFTVSTLPFAILGPQFINIFLITKLKILTKVRFFWIRSIFSSVLGGMIGSTIAIFLVNVGNLPFSVYDKTMFADYAIRFLYAIFGGGPAWLLVFYFKKKENIDVYDIGTNFNPFKLSLKD